ncbi:extracellular solute-binding protein [Paenibacillus silviterrae]|uniref:extracellular solute-binding protein n=1 Tax=Paenibacillus silviterrae TaxID=3242194 RepID=UPI002543D116|nr:extracellular solute-binding protein [Paenibacillus chinjuensis]
MRTTTKKSLALSLAVVMTGSLVAGCTGKDAAPAQSAEGSKTPTKPITLTYWTDLTSNAAASVTSLGQVEMYKELEKRTGVKVNFKHPAAGQVAEQFGLLVASNDLTDVIEYGWVNYPGGPNKAIEDGIIIKLNDLIDKHAPNLKRILDSHPEVKKQISTDNGNIYAFPSLNIQKNRVFGGIMVRKDWLDELGLAQPETIDDWEKVLKAFKEKKGATTPFTLTKGHIGGIPGFLEAFGVNNDFYVDNGVVKYGPYEPAYQQFLTLFSKWYKEGLIDKDFATNDTKAFDSKVTTEKAGAFPGYIGSSMGKFIPALKGKSPNVSLVMVQYPVAVKGSTPKFIPRDWEYNAFGAAAISTSNKHPEETVKWLDYLYGSEGHMLKNFGVEGLTYKMENGYPKYTDLIMKNPDKLSIGEAMGKYFRANYPSPGLADDRYLEQYYDFPQQKEALTTLSKYADNAVKVLMPPATNTPEEAEQLSKIMAEVKTYQSEMLFKFIMGVEPVENFDKYREQLKKMNIEKAISMKQAALDRYNKR